MDRVQNFVMTILIVTTGPTAFGVAAYLNGDPMTTTQWVLVGWVALAVAARADSRWVRKHADD